MAVAIRLTRVGATKRPAYRVIAIDKRRSRDGRALEILGFYDPLTEPATVQLDTEQDQRLDRQGRPAIRHRRAAHAPGRGDGEGRRRCTRAEARDSRRQRQALGEGRGQGRRAGDRGGPGRGTPPRRRRPRAEAAVEAAPADEAPAEAPAAEAAAEARGARPRLPPTRPRRPKSQPRTKRLRRGSRGRARQPQTSRPPSRRPRRRATREGVPRVRREVARSTSPMRSGSRSRTMATRRVLTLGVDQEDMGRVIGRDGRIANAHPQPAAGDGRPGRSPRRARDRLRRRVTAAGRRARPRRQGPEGRPSGRAPDRLARAPRARCRAVARGRRRRRVASTHVETRRAVCPCSTSTAIDSREAAEALTGRYLEVPSRASSSRTPTTGTTSSGCASRIPTASRSASWSRSSEPAATRSIASSARRGSGSFPRCASAVERIDLEAGRHGRRPRRCRGGPLTDADRRRHDLPRALRRARCGPRSSVGRPSTGSSSSGSTTCASTASAVIGRSTTTRTAGEPGWSCAPSRCSRRSSRCATPAPHVVLLDPAGERLTDALARELARLPHLALVCGRYEGIDERVRTRGRPRGQHRRLRPHRRRAAGPRPDRRRRAAPARRDPARRRTRATRSRPACSSTRSTRARSSSADLRRPAGPARRATTARSTAGAGARRCAARSSGGRTSSTRRR